MRLSSGHVHANRPRCRNGQDTRGVYGWFQQPTHLLNPHLETMVHDCWLVLTELLLQALLTSRGPDGGLRVTPSVRQRKNSLHTTTHGPTIVDHGRPTYISCLGHDDASSVSFVWANACAVLPRPVSGASRAERVLGRGAFGLRTWRSTAVVGTSRDLMRENERWLAGLHLVRPRPTYK